MGIKAHLDFTGVGSGKVKILMYKLRSVKMSMWNEERTKSYLHLPFII